MRDITIERYLCGQAQSIGSQALSGWLANTQSPLSFLPMMQYRISGQAAEQCTDIYYIAMDNDQILSRLWSGWGKHENAIGNWGNFRTVDAAQGAGVGRKLLEFWYADIAQEKNKPIGLFCTAANNFLIDLYGSYGFTQGVVKPNYSHLYKPLGDSPPTFPELCEDYYCAANTLIVRPATVEWRHEIDCLLKFALAAQGEAFGLPGCGSLEETIVWPHIGKGHLVFTEKDHAVGWGFTGTDGQTHWQLHPAYRKLFEITYQ